MTRARRRGAIRLPGITRLSLVPRLNGCREIVSRSPVDLGNKFPPRGFSLFEGNGLVISGKGSGNAGRVLLVEDEGLIRLMIAEALQDEGFEVVETGDGEEAA